MTYRIKLSATLGAIAAVVAIAVGTHYCQKAQFPEVAPQAAEVEILDASKIKLVQFDVNFTKNDESIGSYTTSVLVGETNKYQAVDQRAYIASVANNNGMLTLTPGTVNSGLEVDLTPKFLADDGSVLLSFDASYKKLNEMKTFKQDEIEVEWPDLTEVRFIQSINIKKGEPLVIVNQDVQSGEKYKLTIKAY